MQQHPDFPNLHIVDHPLIQNNLTKMRDKNTASARFREYLREISMLMGYEVTRPLPLTTRRIETPIVAMDAPTLGDTELVITSILRAGLGMVEGLRELIPSALEGHVGLYRDPDTHMPVEYLVKLPAAKANREFILADPMLATGNSAAHAVDVLNAHGVPDSQIRFMALVAAPEGIVQFNKTHGEVPIYVAALDECLNDHAYIVPGLGDAGDRIFGTLD